MAAPARFRLRVALGYLSFALASFGLSLYLTFDYSLLIPRLSRALSQATGSEVSIANLEGYRLSGFRIRDLKLASPGPAPEGAAKSALTVDQLTLRLQLLPLLLGQRALTFSARLAGGALQGSLSQKGQQGRIALQIQGLTLDRISLEPWLGPGSLRLGGKLDGQVDLTSEELANPAKWAGKIEMTWGAGKIYPFKAKGVPIEELNYRTGNLKLNVKEGTAQLETLKLEGPDLPISVRGNLSLRAPFAQSILDISGTVEASPAYKEKMPLLNGLLPPEQKFTYTGTVENLASLVRTQ